MKFILLGPVQGHVDDRKDDILKTLRPRQKLFLAVLLLARGARVNQDELIYRLWGSETPADPRGGLHSCASRIRGALRSAAPVDEDPVPMEADGWRLPADPEQTDVHRFRQRADTALAHACRDDAEALRLYREALREWGAPGFGLAGPETLAGLPGEWAAGYRRTLQTEHRNALIGLFEAELRRGRHEHMVPHLTTLTEADDIGREDEQLAGLLMLALYRSNRQAEALRTYRRTYESLKRQGLEPDKELRMLEERIRNQHPALDLPDHHSAQMACSPDRTRDDQQECSQEETRWSGPAELPPKSAPVTGGPTYTQHNQGNTVNAVQGEQYIQYGG